MRCEDDRIAATVCLLRRFHAAPSKLTRERRPFMETKRSSVAFFAISLIVSVFWAAVDGSSSHNDSTLGLAFFFFQLAPLLAALKIVTFSPRFLPVGIACSLGLCLWFWWLCRRSGTFFKTYFTTALLVVLIHVANHPDSRHFGILENLFFGGRFWEAAGYRGAAFVILCSVKFIVASHLGYRVSEMKKGLPCCFALAAFLLSFLYMFLRVRLSLPPFFIWWEIFAENRDIIAVAELAFICLSIRLDCLVLDARLQDREGDNVLLSMGMNIAAFFPLLFL
jgi:hypothetical protein